MLAPLTALVVVQVSVRASVRTALARSAAVVLGVLLALALGDALSLNGFTVALLVAVSLGVAQLVLRLPPAVGAPGADQRPGRAHRRVARARRARLAARLDTLLGAAVGVVVSLVLPASRLVDARQTLRPAGRQPRRHARDDGRRTAAAVVDRADRGVAPPGPHATRDRLVRQAAEAVGNSREAARWNVRDRRHIDVLGRYEDVMPRLERTAIGVSVISRGLDDHARLSGHDPPRHAGDGRAAGRAGERPCGPSCSDVLGEPDDETLARRAGRGHDPPGALRAGRVPPGPARARAGDGARGRRAGGRVARLRRPARPGRPHRRAT